MKRAFIFFTLALALVLSFKLFAHHTEKFEAPPTEEQEYVQAEEYNQVETDKAKQV